MCIRDRHLRVAKAMLKEGRAVNVGDHIPHVICMGSDKNVADRSYHPDAVATVTKIDEENRPPSAKEAEAPPVVTPGSSEKPSLEKPKVDVEWYLTQQILPPIARLCEPIAGMSRASIADKLGLDARKFAAAMARSQSALDEANANMRSFTPASLQSDEERFADCQPLVVECGSCKLRWPLPLEQRGARARLEAARDAATPAKAAACNALACGHCGAKLLGYKNAASCFSRVSVALQMATRASLKDYYDGWMVCDDSACGARTRQLSCAGVRCLSRGCKGKLVPEANEKRIYTQLQYYRALFDDDRLACPPKSDEREVAKFIMKQVADDMGVGHTFRMTPVGVYFGTPGVSVPDPYFGGRGPARTGCVECGECMTGCRWNAKNTPPKNYLHLAELAGARILPMTTVIGVDPLPGGGYRIETRATGSVSYTHLTLPTKA